MHDAIDPETIITFLGKRIEVIAFGISYAGLLTSVDPKAGIIRVEDGRDYVVLEIERIEEFHPLRVTS